MTTLFTYLQRVKQLSADQNESLFNSGFITTYINVARGQVASEGNCIRDYSTLAWTAGTQSLPFSSITPSNAAISAILNIRTISYGIASGKANLRPRPWEWFNYYELGNPVPQQGLPNIWTQQGQGTAGTLWLSKVPNLDLTLYLDTVCLPIDLVDNTTAEAIPYPWTDAVPFYALWLLFQQARLDGVADKMYERYENLMKRARSTSTSTVLPYIYPQTQDPTALNKLGLELPSNNG